MALFITPIFWLSRLASSSGHLLLASGVDCEPSVIESPKVTIPPIFREVTTSTPANQNHACVVGLVESIGMAALAVKSPWGETERVWRASKCHAAGPVSPCTKML